MRRELTDGKVNTLANTRSDSVIDGLTSSTAKGEVDNGGLARGDSMTHSSVDSGDNVGKAALSFVGEHFDGKDRGTCGWPEFTRKIVRIGAPGGAISGLHSSGGTSGVGTMAISIGVGKRAKGGKPGGTSSEGRVLDKYSGIDTWSRVRS